MHITGFFHLQHEVAVASGYRNSGITIGKKGKVMAVSLVECKSCSSPCQYTRKHGNYLHVDKELENHLKDKMWCGDKIVNFL